MAKKREALGPQGQLLFTHIEASGEGAADNISAALGLIPEQARLDIQRGMQGMGEAMRKGFEKMAAVFPAPVVPELGVSSREPVTVTVSETTETVTIRKVPGETGAIPPAPGPVELGRMKRDLAIERVQRGAPLGWMEAAAKAIDRVARTKARFTSDDVWDTGLEPPPEPRALGAAFTKAVRRGVIRRTGQFTQTRRSSRHAAPIAVWESCVMERDT